jgi:hypothetical protein
MLEAIINKFLERYHTDFSLGGYSLHKVTHSPSISVLNMRSDDYILKFSFFNELPFRLLVDIHRSDQLKLNEKNKTVILNRELSFFPFNNHKHEILDTIQKDICERIGVCEVVDATDDPTKLASDNLYNARFNNKLFQVLPSMKKTVGGQQIFRLNNYVINVTSDGEVFYSTKTYYSFDNEYFIFNNNDDFYSYCGIDYTEHELESLFFKIIVNRINNEIFKETEISLMHESEDFIKKAINVYKMIKI